MIYAIQCLYSVFYAKSCLNSKEIWWGLIKLVSLAFGLKLELLDKLKLRYGIRYVCPFGDNLSSFLLKTFFVGSVLKYIST